MILNNNKPSAKLGRSSFDLSSTHALSMRPAVLRPVVVQDTVPDSAFRINATDLVRTSALQTAAFLRGKHELDFFFVPYSLLYSRFRDVVDERADAQSPAIINAVPDLHGSLPVVPLEHLLFSAAIPYCFMRYCQYIKTTQPNLKLQPVLASFIKGFNNHHVQPSLIIVSMLVNVVSYNHPIIDENTSIDELSFIGADVLCLLDTLGYSNFYPLLNDICNFITSNPQSAWAQNCFDKLISVIRTIFTNPDFEPSVQSSGFRLVSPLRLFAYQKTFYDRYRDEIFDDSYLYSWAVSADYSLDALEWNPCETIITSSALSNRNPLLTFLHPRTRMVKKDIVSGVFPTSQFGDAALLSNLADESDVTTGQDNPDSAFSIRFALALQKYRETLLRAGNRSKDVLKAMFGVESRYINDTYVHYIGSFSGQLDLNKVSATADGGEFSVGDLAGNVFSSLQGNTIEFTCNDYGVIIGVLSFFPELMHNNYGISPFNLKLRPLQFFKSQFEDLGLQPVPSSYVSMFNNNRGTGKVQFSDETLGFAARYNEYKQNLDFSHDSFGTRFPNLQLDNEATDVIPTNDGFNSNYVVTRRTASDLSISVDRNYLLPDCMDSIFKSLDTGDLTNYHFDLILDVSINAVLPMSQVGLPY